MRALPVIVLLAALAAPAAALEVVLVYQGETHGVAPADNKPLIRLLAEAKKGVRRYTVLLPTENRALAVERLDVLSGLLAREAKGSVVMVEGTGKAKANTLKVSDE
jgi:hypothetical protein